MEFELPPDAPAKSAALFAEIIIIFEKLARQKVLQRIADDRAGLKISEEQATTFADAARDALRRYGAEPAAAARYARECRRRLMAPSSMRGSDKVLEDEVQFTLATLAMTWVMTLQDAAEGNRPEASLDPASLGDDLLPNPLASHHAEFIESRLARTVISLDDFRRILCFVSGKYDSPARLPFAVIELLALDGVTVLDD